jgi:hypothetical protein
MRQAETKTPFVAGAGPSDAQLRALSRHRTANMTVLYAEQTMKQRQEGARKRLAQRTKAADFSECPYDRLSE